MDTGDGSRRLELRAGDYRFYPDKETREAIIEDILTCPVKSPLVIHKYLMGRYLKRLPFSDTETHYYGASQKYRFLSHDDAIESKYSLLIKNDVFNKANISPIEWDKLPANKRRIILDICMELNKEAIGDTNAMLAEYLKHNGAIPDDQ